MQLQVLKVLKLIGFSLAVCFMFSVPALGGVVGILDLTDIVTATDNGTTGGRFSTNPGSCTSTSNEECIITLSAPTGTGVLVIQLSAQNIYEDSSFTTLSDTFQIVSCTPTPPSLATCWKFNSDSDNGPPLSPVIPSNVPPIVENGAFQTAVVINYFSVTGAPIATDTIQFQSDTVVPEPATVVLALGGLAFLGVRMRRRRSAIGTR